MTCDAFADAWAPFFGMFFKCWPDCPYKVYLCGESITFDHPRVLNISAGKGKEWSARLLVALDQIPDEYLLFMLEDYVLLRRVDTDRIERQLDTLIESGAAYLRLIPAPAPDEPLPGYRGVGIIKPGSPYRNSTQAALWRKESLMNLLDPSENIWDFELVGVERTKSFKEPFLSVEPDAKNSPAESGDYPLVYYSTAISRGKWMRDAVAMIREAGFDVDLTKRPQETIIENRKRLLQLKYPKLVRRRRG